MSTPGPMNLVANELTPPRSHMVRVSRTSLDRSLQQAMGGGVAIWQFVPIVAAATSDLHASLATVIAVHTVAAVATVTVLRTERVPTGLGLVVIAWGVQAFGLYAAEGLDSPLGFATVWTQNFAMLMPTVMLSGVLGLSASVVGVVYSVIATMQLRPDWDGVPAAVAVTGTAMIIVGSVLIRHFRQVADRIDDQLAAASSAAEESARVQTLRREAAVAARTMHDTAVNTLAAIAAGGVAVRDIDLVRSHARRDVAVLEALLEGHAPDPVPPSLVGIGKGLGVEVKRYGLSDTDLEVAQARIPAEVLIAIRGAADEAVRNVTRHAGVTTADIEVRTTNADLTVQIRDSGRGFDQANTQLGHGLLQSVMGRAAEHRIDTSIESARGMGTTVTLRWSEPESEPRPGAVESESADIAYRLRRWACWLWTAAVLVTGVIIEAFNRPGRLTEIYPALAMTGVLCALAWWSTRGKTALPPLLGGVLAWATPVAYVLGFASVGYGADEPVHWQSLALTPLMVTLLVTKQRRQLLLTFVLLSAAVMTATIILAFRDPEHAGLAIVGVVPSVGLLAGWVVFYRLVGSMARSMVAARRSVEMQQAELVEQQAASLARARWQEAGAAQAMDVLRRIAQGVDDPTDPLVGDACGREEQFLRQVMHISPESVHLAPWHVRALERARRRQITLNLRAGDVDAGSVTTAATIGRIVLDCVESTPQDETLTVSMFPAPGDRLHLLVVASQDLPTESVPPTWHRQVSDCGDHRMLEVISAS